MDAAKEATEQTNVSREDESHANCKNKKTHHVVPRQTIELNDKMPKTTLGLEETLAVALVAHEDARQLVYAELVEEGRDRVAIRSPSSTRTVPVEEKPTGQQQRKGVFSEIILALGESSAK